MKMPSGNYWLFDGVGPKRKPRRTFYYSLGKETRLRWILMLYFPSDMVDVVSNHKGSKMSPCEAESGAGFCVFGCTSSWGSQ
jgi:hypothetical protein